MTRNNLDQFSYIFGKLQVLSDLELSCFHPCEPAEESSVASILLERCAQLDRSKETTVQFALNGFDIGNHPDDTITIDCEHARFRILPATNGLQYSPRAGTTPDTLEHLLVDLAMPLAATSFGHTFIHGATLLSPRGGAVALIGQSGWGKSTLSQAIAKMPSYHCGGDDMFQLDDAEGLWRVWPSYPSLRLNDDSLAELAIPATEVVGDLRGYNLKKVLRPSDVVPVPREGFRLDALYFLDPPSPDVQEISIRELKGAKAVERLLPCSMRAAFKDTGKVTAEFLTLASLCDALPAFRLSYPRNFKLLGTVASTLTGHWQTAVATSPT